MREALKKIAIALAAGMAAAAGTAIGEVARDAIKARWGPPAPPVPPIPVPPVPPPPVPERTARLRRKAVRS